MTSISIAAAACYLPATSVAVSDLPELAALRPEERATCAALGIDRVAADDTLSPVDLAARAARRALAEAGLDPTDLDVLLAIESRAPETLISSEATRLQAMLGAEKAMAFTAGGLGCASMTPALLTARGLLCADPTLSTVLIVHGSKPATPHRYRHPVTVNGDSGAALVLTRTAPLTIRDMVLETNGAYWNLFDLPYRDRISTRWREECTDLRTYSFRLAVETRNRLRSLTSRLLNRNNLTPPDIACYLTQNLSQSAFRSYAEALNVPIAKPCQENLALHGHLGPNDLVLNLSSAITQGHLPPNHRAILLNTSPAAAWSALLLETGPTPSHLAL